MADSDSKPGAGISAIVNAILIIVTVAGFLTLAGHQLTSDRPATPSSADKDAIGSQSVDVRLWEDPLRPSKTGKTVSPDALDAEIREKAAAGSLRFLPVMVAGGPYSEDKETRIRTRFAVVSALGHRGYAPEDEEHVGEVKIPWPTTAELSPIATPAPATIQGESSRRLRRSRSPFAPVIPSAPAPSRTATSTGSLSLRFEWYRPRVFHPHSHEAGPVLVLWIDEELFGDEPLRRLALLFDKLPRSSANATTPTVSLIGPRTSQTLRMMLPPFDIFDGRSAPRPLSTTERDILGRIELFSATASAMDEVLTPATTVNPREGVRQKLTQSGFGAAHFFNPTDAQLADEVLQELDLRNVHLRDPKEHLVLLSEWDSFYGRILSLTYGALLHVKQSTRGTNLAAFVESYRNGVDELPENLHSFAYLRGLDGRSVCDGSSADCSPAETGAQKKTRPDSFEQVVQWKPEANKAEGASQFDYLSRIGDHLQALETELGLKGSGTIKAVGIVGSDTYDVLAILQALRNRFPQVVFFTTTLDARLWNPKERERSRNLVVVSGHGLSLGGTLQEDIAPFRDSSQTAVYAATLAALDSKDLDVLSTIAPRRFEIGNATAVDLSVTPSGGLHPPTTSEANEKLRAGRKRNLWLAILVVSFVTALGSYFAWNPIRHRCSADAGWLSRYLEFDASDVGGSDGAQALIRALHTSADSFCRWLHDGMASQLDGSLTLPSDRKARDRVVAVLVATLNDLLHRDRLMTEATLVDSNFTPDPVERASLCRQAVPWWRGPLRLLQRYRTRVVLNRVLDSLSSSLAPKLVLRVARDARASGREQFLIRIRMLALLGGLSVGAVFMGLRLGSTIWNDTFAMDNGEPFSLVSGTSAWPNICLRVLSAWLAMTFIVALLGQLRILICDLTRKYRLPLDPHAQGAVPMRVQAAALWHTYERGGQVWLRIVRSVVPTALYFLAGYYLLSLFGWPVPPVRGESATFWAEATRRWFVGLFLFLGFLTIDAALRCRRFINDLAALPTHYPSTTLSHFRSLRGQVDDEYLEEWIDIQLVADATEYIGRLLWYPMIVFALMLAALNSWTDNWSTPIGLLMILIVNFGVAIASVVILQRAAKNARRDAEESLVTKLKQAQQIAAVSPAANTAKQAEDLLKEIRELRRGAFVGFWENPALSAVLLPSGGTAIVQLLTWLWR